MAITGFGTTVKVTVNGTETQIGLLQSVSEIKMDSEMIDVTPLDAPGGYRRYQQGMKDAGEVTLEGFLSAEEAGESALRALYTSGEEGKFTVTFSDGEKAAFSALVKSVSAGSSQVDEPVKFICVLKLTGKTEWS